VPSLLTRNLGQVKVSTSKAADSIDYADYLPLDTQMNSQADALATMELVEYSTPLHSVPFDPESWVPHALYRWYLHHQPP
jgi:hypothetical protein